MALGIPIMSPSRRPATLFLVILTIAAVSWAIPRCDDGGLKGLLPVNAFVEAVVPVNSGGTYGEGAFNLAYPKQPTNLPELCAVTIHVQSSPTSAYRFGLFLPTAWNGRFLAVGSGGFAGGINWPEMGVGVKYGFAVVSTDTGHSSTATNGSWALRSPEKRTDWGWRAMHGSVALGKQLVAAHYGKAIAYSYYSGCSTGGRQGLKEVQISPGSFDGVLVGAPAWWTTHVNTWITKAGTYNLPADGPNHVKAALFASMAREVIRKCDGLDGVEDGIVSAPEKCRPDYDVLSCSRPGAKRSACLTSDQMAMPRNIYADYRASTGELLYPGLSPGCEHQWAAVVNQTT